jgi:gamma-glutamyl-gamma-aminobutyrate hydrolase PuuD
MPLDLIQIQPDMVVRLNKLWAPKDFDNLKPNLPKPKIFWGGADLDPSFYGKERSKRCGTSFIDHDKKLLDDMRTYMAADIPIIGICRSAQALNVLNGGILVQHIDNHTKKHDLTLYNKENKETGNCKTVSSTHHQMMVAHKDGIILAKANEPTTGVHWDNVNEPYEYKYVTEVVYYPKTKSLCIQPHPEWMPQDHYFIHWLNNFMFEEWGIKPIDFHHEERKSLGVYT